MNFVIKINRHQLYVRGMARMTPPPPSTPKSSTRKAKNKATYHGGSCGKSSSLGLIHSHASVKRGSNPALVRPVIFVR
jgi:hypothetical protein